MYVGIVMILLCVPQRGPAGAVLLSCAYMWALQDLPFPTQSICLVTLSLLSAWKGQDCHRTLCHTACTCLNLPSKIHLVH